MNVRELREKINFSQQELADKTGIPKDRIAKWEQGKGSPKVEDANILHQFFEEHVPRATKEKEGRLNEDSAGASQHQLIEAIITLTRNNEKVIDTNATIADTNKVLADKLVSMKTIESADQRTFEESVALLKALRDYTLELGAQVNKTKKIHQEQSLNKKVMSAMGKGDKKDIHSEVNMQRNG